MSKPTKTGLPSRKNFVTSFLLSLILIGSTISSTLLLGLTISPQEAWAVPPATAPSLTAPPNGQVTADQTPTFDWNSVSASPSLTFYHLLVDNNNDFSSPVIDITTASSTTEHTPTTNMAFDTYS